jgi:hypothetical protein
MGILKKTLTVSEGEEIQIDPFCNFPRLSLREAKRRSNPHRTIISPPPFEERDKVRGIIFKTYAENSSQGNTVTKQLKFIITKPPRFLRT